MGHHVSCAVFFFFVEPIGEFCRLWILVVSQHVLSHDGSCNLRCLALGIVEIGSHSHDHLFVHSVDVLCHLWILDVSQPVLSRDGPCILRCLALVIVEIGKHNHDHVVQESARVYGDLSQSAVHCCGHWLLHHIDLLLELLDHVIVFGSLVTRDIIWSVRFVTS